MLVALAACSHDADVSADAGHDAPQPECAAGFLGDPVKSPEIELRAIRADETDAPLKEGDDVALIFPPQGGRVVFVGVRATNVNGCGVQLSGAVTDPQTKQVRIDARTVNLNATGDGWGTSGVAMQSVSAAIANYSNIPLCPNQWSATDVFDHVYELEVTLKDRERRSVTKAIHVTPRCAEPTNLDECLCICKVGYVLGEACGATDGGADAGVGG